MGATGGTRRRIQGRADIHLSDSGRKAGNVILPEPYRARCISSLDARHGNPRLLGLGRARARLIEMDWASGRAGHSRAACERVRKWR